MENQPNNVTANTFVDPVLTQMVNEAEKEINLYANKAKEIIPEYVDQINKHFFTTEASRTQRILGLVALGTQSDNVPTVHKQFEDLTDVTIRGFEIHRTLVDVDPELSGYAPERYKLI